MTFSPISRLFLLMIGFRFNSFMIKLSMNRDVLSRNQSSYFSLRLPVLFLWLLRKAHQNPSHVVYPYQILFSVVSERIFYKLVDAYANDCKKKRTTTTTIDSICNGDLFFSPTKVSGLKFRPQFEHG